MSDLLNYMSNLFGEFINFVFSLNTSDGGTNVGVVYVAICVVIIVVTFLFTSVVNHD